MGYPDASLFLKLDFWRSRFPRQRGPFPPPALAVALGTGPVAQHEHAAPQGSADTGNLRGATSPAGLAAHTPSHSSAARDHTAGTRPPADGTWHRKTVDNLGTSEVLATEDWTSTRSCVDTRRRHSLVLRRLEKAQGRAAKLMLPGPSVSSAAGFLPYLPPKHSQRPGPPFTGGWILPAYGQKATGGYIAQITKMTRFSVAINTWGRTRTSCSHLLRHGGEAHSADRRRNVLLRNPRCSSAPEDP